MKQAIDTHRSRPATTGPANGAAEAKPEAATQRQMESLARLANAKGIRLQDELDIRFGFMTDPTAVQASALIQEWQAPAETGPRRVARH